jgi:hypothetical protein
VPWIGTPTDDPAVGRGMRPPKGTSARMRRVAAAVTRTPVSVLLAHAVFGAIIGGFYTFT